MKKICIFIIGIMCLTVTGCLREEKKEDIVKKYFSYWKYSLGDYTYTSYDKMDSSAAGLSATYYKLFTFKFKNSKLQNKSISVSNKDEDFNDSIIEAAKDYIKKDIDNIIKNSKPIKSKGISVDNLYSFSLSRKDSSVNLYDSSRGVRFKDLSIQNLDNNNLDLSINFNVDLSKNINKYPNLKDVLFSYVKNFYSLNKNIETKFILNVKNHEIYCLVLTYFNSKYNWKFNN